MAISILYIAYAYLKRSLRERGPGLRLGGEAASTARMGIVTRDSKVETRTSELAVSASPP